MIVSEPLQLAKQEILDPLGAENNTWVSNVSEPILRYYQLLFNKDGLAIYIPKLDADLK